MRDGKRPTMRDVAALAGVSFKTVSRVVNAEAGVSPAVTLRVREAIDQLGFRPHVGARGLRRADARTASIGLLLDDVANPFAASIQRAVEDVALPRGVVVFSASIDEDPDRERLLVSTFTDRRADGLILVPTDADHGYVVDELRAGTTVVCVDRQAPDLDVDAVVSTNEAGAAEGVRHLLAAGHTRIAYLGDRPRISTAAQRLAGYRSAVAAAGLPVDPALVVTGVAAGGAAEQAVDALFRLPDPPTALFTAQNMITLGAIRALHRFGRQRLVAVVGFDDFTTADLLSPGVTVVAQDPGRIGRTAAERLFRRLAGEAGPPAVHTVPTVLIPRGSGELPPLR